MVPRVRYSWQFKWLEFHHTISHSCLTPTDTILQVMLLDVVHKQCQMPKCVCADAEFMDAIFYTPQGFDNVSYPVPTCLVDAVYN